MTKYIAFKINAETRSREFFGAADYDTLTEWIREWRIAHPDANTTAFDIREQQPIC